MYLSADFLGVVSVSTINCASVSKFLLISSSSVDSSDDMSFIFLFFIQLFCFYVLTFIKNIIVKN